MENTTEITTEYAPVKVEVVNFDQFKDELGKKVAIAAISAVVGVLMTSVTESLVQKAKDKREFRKLQKANAKKLTEDK